jgi:starch-binding outer membrane protein, SusD/RagB family
LQYDVDISNPLYNLLMTTATYRANPDVIETYFPINELVDPDSADVRGDRGSYRSAMNYAIWKHIGVNRTSVKVPSQATSNFIVYRYADILLMKAEALALQVVDGDEASALKAQQSLDLIKQIRTRARANKATEDFPSSRESLLDYILMERTREFAFEGKRWFDLLRFAKRDNYAKKIYLNNMVLASAPATRMLAILAKMQNPDYHYMPIPQSDIDAGYPYLEQNPFYKN